MIAKKSHTFGVSTEIGGTPGRGPNGIISGLRGIDGGMGTPAGSCFGN
jgi:hypothetical protein